MTITQLTARQRHPEAALGKAGYAKQLQRKRTLINKTPQAYQINTVTVTDPGDNTDVTIIINGVSITVNTATGLDAAGIVLLLVAAINAEPLVRGQVSASASTNTVILTGLWPGDSFTVDDSDGALSDASTQTPADAEAVPFGRALIATGVDSDGGALLGGLAKSSLFTAQEDQIGIAYVALASYLITISPKGMPSYQVSVVADTNQDTTITNIVTAINAMMPANTVIASDNDSGANDADTLILTAEIAGLEFEVTIGATDAGASIPVFTHTSNKGITTSFYQAFVGVSLRSDDEEVTTVAGTSVSYPANAGVKALASDTIWVANTEGVSFGDAVYVELGSSNSGKFYNSSSSTRLPLPGWRWERAAYNSDDGLALLRMPQSN